MNAKIVIEEYVAPVKSPHPLHGTVMALVEAGPSKVATGTFDSEEEALTFVRSMQTAAREVNRSARKRRFEEVDGKWIAGVSVRDKITRSRPTAIDTATEETASEETDKAETAPVGLPKNKK